MDNLIDKYLDDDDLNEVKKKVIRKGQIKTKTICPVSTMKAQDGKCVMMGATERKKRKKAAIKRGRKIRSNKGLQKNIARKRAKSMRKRAMRIPKTGAPNMEITEMNDKLIDKYLGVWE